MAPAGGGDEAGGSGGLRMRRGVDRSAAADGYGGGGSPSASTSEEESGLAGRSGGRDERGAEQRRTGSGGGKGWGARARTGAEDLWWRGGRGGPAEDECGPAGSGAAGASACPYWQKRLLPAGGGRKGQNLGVESGSRKRKSAVKSEDSISLVGNGEHLKVPHEHSQSILKEIEDLRAQLDEDVKKLGYCEANQKLGVALTMKVGEMQCLRKQNEEMQGKSNGMRKQNEELQAMNDGLAKLNKELRAKNDGLVKENEELRTNMDSMMKRNGVLQVKNGSLTKWSWELQAKIGGLAKQIEELQAKNDGLTKQNEELQAKHVSLVKQNEEVQTNNDSMKKKNGELQAKNCVLTKHNEELQAKNDSLTKWIEELEANNDGLEDLNGSLVRKERQSNDELQQARKELTVVLEEKSNGQTAIEIKRMGELDEKPFQNACKRKYGNDDYQTKAAELVAIWRDEIKKPSWHPFMVVQVNGEQKEVVDDNDAKLKLLRSEYGDDVCDAVKTALMEINKYSPSERCAVPQFWNFKKGRKATTREALKYLF